MDYSFESRLKDTRISRGYKTKKEFATKYGFEYKTYRQWEKGVVKPSLDSLGSLADALNTSTDFLLGRIDSEDDLISSVQKLTGLSAKAIQKLMNRKNAEETDTLSSIIVHPNYKMLMIFYSLATKTLQEME